MILSNMEREVLKAFIDAYYLTKDPNFTVELRNVKYPRGMNGPQKLDIHNSLRKKGAFYAPDGSSGIQPTEQLTQAAFEFFALRMGAKYTPNIDFMKSLAQKFLDGEIDRRSFDLEFDYNLMARFAKMRQEDRSIADAFAFFISEMGVDTGRNLSDETYRDLLSKQYAEFLDSVDE